MRKLVVALLVLILVASANALPVRGSCWTASRNTSIGNMSIAVNPVGGANHVLVFLASVPPPVVNLPWIISDGINTWPGDYDASIFPGNISITAFTSYPNQSRVIEEFLNSPAAGPYTLSAGFVGPGSFGPFDIIVCEYSGITVDYADGESLTANNLCSLSCSSITDDPTNDNGVPWELLIGAVYNFQQDGVSGLNSITCAAGTIGGVAATLYSANANLCIEDGVFTVPTAATMSVTAAHPVTDFPPVFGVFQFIPLGPFPSASPRKRVMVTQ